MSKRVKSGAEQWIRWVQLKLTFSTNDFLIITVAGWSQNILCGIKYGIDYQVFSWVSVLWQPYYGVCIELHQRKFKEFGFCNCNWNDCKNIMLINQCANKFMLHLLWGKLQLQSFSTEFSNQTSIHASELSCMIHPSIYLLKHFRVVGVWNFSQEILGESTWTGGGKPHRHRERP